MIDYTIDYSKHCRVESGIYTEKHDDAPPTNTMSERLQVAIYLGTNKNFQGSYKFTSLRKRRRIARKKFIPPPVSKSVMKQVEDMDIKEDHNKDIILADINRSTLEVYNYGVNKNDVTAGVDNNYKNYNNNATSFEDGANNKEDNATHEDRAGVNITHEYGTIYTKNTPVNYEQ